MTLTPKASFKRWFIPFFSLGFSVCVCVCVCACVCVSCGRADEWCNYCGKQDHCRCHIMTHSCTIFGNLNVLTTFKHEVALCGTCDLCVCLCVSARACVHFWEQYSKQLLFFTVQWDPRDVRPPLLHSSDCSIDVLDIYWQTMADWSWLCEVRMTNVHGFIQTPLTLEVSPTLWACGYLMGKHNHFTFHRTLNKSHGLWVFFR